MTPPMVVRYGPHPSQHAELNLPERTPRGLAVVVHGGFWKPRYGIELARPLVPSLVAAGWAAWAIEYRRGEGAAATFADVRTAIGSCPLEGRPMVAIGHSAGGHLAAWAAGQRLGLTHVVSQAGVLDLRAAHADGLGDGAVARFLGHTPGPADAGADPMQALPVGVPVWCIHGRADQNVPLSQSRAYVAAAVAAGDPAELVELDGDHFDLIDPAHDAWARTLAHLEALAG